MADYDSIIIGGGHNGLVCAAYLAKAGHQALVMEAADAVGGLGAAREFHPGFRATVAHSVAHFSNKVASDLDLADHGYAANATVLPFVGLSATREHVVVRDGAVIGTAAADASRFEAYSAQMQRFANVLAPFWHKTMPRIGNPSLSDMVTVAHLGLNLRRIGKKDMGEFLRVASLPARDLMDEYFNNEQLKAMLCWDGLIGSKLAPRSPNSAVLMMLYRMAEASSGSHQLPTCGVNGLTDALAATASAAGAEIRCGSPVDRILIDGSADGLSARGVQLENGEKITAANVISATDPKRTFLNLVGVEHLDIGFTNRIRRLRCTGYVAKLHLALNAAPEIDGIDTPDGRMIIAPTMDSIEFAFDDAKYGGCPDKPVLEVVVPSLSNTAAAPDDQHVLSAHVMYVPHDLKGGWNETARERMRERAIDSIALHAPRIREQILHSEFLTPADLEADYRVTGGHWHHTEFAMDQMLMMRPTYEAAQYSTPIPGLYLCGAGSHPGGDLTGTAGHNAAREILR